MSVKERDKAVFIKEFGILNTLFIFNSLWYPTKNSICSNVSLFDRNLKRKCDESFKQSNAINIVNTSNFATDPQFLNRIS